VCAVHLYAMTHIYSFTMTNACMFLFPSVFPYVNVPARVFMCSIMHVFNDKYSNMCGDVCCEMCSIFVCIHYFAHDDSCQLLAVQRNTHVTQFRTQVIL